ncbi:uncharacterized protein LOC122501450 [Leptopilina heterotoma]|uniref:uncharacterized protein LOC122501450 n=1 Tax=Leptopilina heterotoma TaxID=63436 RepID=UPI001CA8E853|nr:uncharacterized protein LOC122501450 [Leptopilina heterotoma]
MTGAIKSRACTIEKINIGNSSESGLLIFLSTNNIENSGDTESVILNKTSNFSCRFTFEHNAYDVITGKICFSNLALNKQCEVKTHLVYLPTSESRLVVINETNVTCSDVYEKFFSMSPKSVDEDAIFCNKILIYCVIIEKDIPLLKIDIPKDEKSAYFLSLYEEKLFTDFKIICEAQEFCVHKIILGHSPVFKAMLQCPMKESTENVLTISDFKPTIVEIMIRYLYSGGIKAELCEDELQQLLLIANKYNLEELKTTAINEILKTIKTFTKALDFFLFAESNNLDSRDLIVKFMKDNKRIWFEE